MEEPGSQIISELRSSKSWGGFDTRVKEFLGNALGSPKRSSTTLAKCELFCLRLFKLCTEKLQSKADIEVASNIGVMCIANLSEISGASVKAPKLGFEKILLHFSRACLKNKLYSECEDVVAVLYTQIGKSSSKSTDDLLAPASEDLWKASTRAANETQISPEIVLRMRQLAIKCLQASNKCDLSQVMVKALSADSLYSKSIRQQFPDSASLEPAHFKTLFDFHCELIDIRKMFTKCLPCGIFVSASQYALAVVKVGIQTSEKGNMITAMNVLDRTRDLLCHHRCRECSEGDLEVVKCQQRAMAVWVPLHSGQWVSDKDPKPLRELSLSLDKVASVRPTASVLLKLIETLELIIVSLTQVHRESLILEATSQDSSVFEHFENVFKTAVTLLDVFLKGDHSDPVYQKGRKRQLQLLRFYGNVLVDLLSSTMELEVSRSSRCDHTLPSHAPNNVAGQFYPVLKQSQDILKKAGSQLCVSEHRWLGVDAFNIGQALLDHGKLTEACQVFNLSVEELTVWVQEGESIEAQLGRAKEVHLHSVLLMFASTHKNNSDPLSAMTILSKALILLPISLVSTSHCTSDLVALWVKLKELISSNNSGTSLCDCLGWTIVREADSLPDDVKIQYLECELQTGKSSHLPSDALLPVVDTLTTLHTTHLQRARLTIEQAILIRGHDQPTTLLDKAIEMLEGCEVACAYEQLAIAHLWKAICVGEQSIEASLLTNERCKPCDKAEQEKEIMLSHDEEQLMTSDDITLCLQTSVEYWEKLVGDMETELCDLSLEYLSLTVQLTLAHSQPVWALRALKVILQLTSHPHTSTQATLTHLTSLALYFDLLLSLGVPSDRPLLTELETVAGSLDKEYISNDLSRRDGVRVSVALCHCRLSLTQVHLKQGQIDTARTLLLSVLTSTCLKETSSLTFDLMARAKLLAADLIQQEGFQLKDTPQLLSNLAACNERNGAELTPIELVIDASRILQNIADHKSVFEECGSTEKEEDLNRALMDEATPTFSSSVGAWCALVGVLGSLRRVSRLYLTQGLLRKAHGKAREGALLARSVCLQGWYTEFLLLLANIQRVLGSHHLSALHCNQAATLLDCVLPVVTGDSKDENNVIGDNKDGDNDVMTAEDKVVTGGSKRQGNATQHYTDVSLISIDSDSSNSITSPLLKGQQALSPSSHPPMCQCSLCTSLLANIQTGRLIAQHCTNTLDQTLHRKGPSATQQEIEAVQRVATQLVLLLCRGKELLTQRRQVCERQLTSLLRKKNRKLKVSRKHTLDSDVSLTCTDFVVSQMEMSVAMGNCHLALLEPIQAIERITSTLNDFGLPLTSQEMNRCIHYHDSLSLCLAMAHYTLGVARLQLIETKQPDIARQLWANPSPLADKENEGAILEVKRSTRSAAKPRRTRNSKPLSELNSGTRSKKDSCTKRDCLKDDVPFPREPLDHFVLSYQLGSWLSSAQLVRDACRWMSVLLSCDSSRMSAATACLAESMQVSMLHQTSLALGVRIRSQSSTTPLQHASETVASLTPHTSSQDLPSNLKLAREALYTPSHPSLPNNWIVCTITPSPTTHYTQPSHLLITKVTGELKQKKKSNSKPLTHNHAVFVKASLPDGGMESFLYEFNELQERVKKSMEPCEIRRWWAIRRQLDIEMKELFEKFERDFVGPFLPTLCLPSGGAVILVLGEKVVSLPWECVGVLSDKVVCRMPSLRFTAAHMYMADHTGQISLDPSSAFYVLNPQRDLLKTEALFAGWFSQQDKWEGVIGRPPTDTEFTTALQNKDLYVYCGHNFGNFLTNTGFQHLSCRSTALLLGCSSAQLQEKGWSDPTGAPFKFLMSGCPSVVGCLWEVTDGDIDRFSKALLKSITSNSSYLSTIVGDSRRACKLPWITGAAPVVYGVPVSFKLHIQIPELP